MKDYVGDMWDWENLIPHLEDDLRTGEFEVSKITEIFGMRDEAEVAEFNAEYDASLLEQIQEAWDELQAVPSYVEQQAVRFVSEE